MRCIFTQVDLNDTEFVKNEFLHFCKNQKLKNAIMQSVDFLKGGQYDSIKRIVDDALKAGTERDIGHDYARDIELRMSETARETITTGQDVIDDLTNGGLGPGELGVVISSAGGGKSWCLASLGKSAMEKGHNVLHYTMELNECYVGLRYDSCFTGIPFQDIMEHEEKVKGRSTQGIRFSDLQKLWEASELDSSNNLRNKTLGQYKLGQNDFIEKFGNIDLATLNTKETCRRFITYLHKEYHKQIGKEPLANGTIKNKKSGVSVLLDYAVDSPDIKIDVNAWKGVAVSAKIGRELKPTMAWSREMLEALFSMPMDTNHKLIFRIANILGCRLEEASSLQWGDIRKHNGVLCVDLTRESLLVKSNRNIKGQSSARRLIPIVPILEHYLKEHKKNFKKPYENKQLTGGWAKDKDGKVSGSVSKKLNRKYVKKVVPQDSVYTYNIHSFRNTLLDNCAKVGIDPVIADEIVGHSKKEMRKHYRYPPFWEDKDKLKEVYKKLSTIDYSYTKGGK